MESSGGKEDQFWANGVSESLPPPSRPNYRTHSEHEQFRQERANTPLNVPPRTSTPSVRKARLDVDNSAVSSRRKMVSSTSLSRKRPQSIKIPMPHAHASSRDLSRATRSAGPYASAFPHNNRQIYGSSRTTGGSPSSGSKWSQFKSRSGSSLSRDCDFDEIFDDSLLLSSKSSARMPPPRASSFATYSHQPYEGTARPTLSSEGPSFLPPVVPQRADASSMLHTNYPMPNLPSHMSGLPADSSPAIDGGTQQESIFNVEDATYDAFWPYPASAMLNGDELPWSADQSLQQQGQFASMAPFASSNQSAFTAYDSSYQPATTQPTGLSFGQSTQPAPHQTTPFLSNEHQSFNTNQNIYGTSGDINAANLFENFHFPQTSYPNTDGMSMDSFPNIVQDEDGMFHLEGQTEVSRTFRL